MWGSVQADLEDKAAHEPPRLGRHRFKPERPQVLTSDNVTGCLRTLRTVPLVAKDRFKSLQKRGVVQVCIRCTCSCTLEQLVDYVDSLCSMNAVARRTPKFCPAGVRLWPLFTVSAPMGQCVLPLSR